VIGESEPHVLVVGAGPTGLLLAAELERREVPCLLVDALDAPQGWDRATVVHARSLQVLEALGLVDAFLDAGVRTYGARFFSGGELLGRLDLALVGGRYPFDVGVSEEVTVTILTGFLESHGGAVTRSTRLVELAPGDDAVAATLERGGERRTVTVPWVVGCDGVRSAVRAAAGIDFPGADIEGLWAVFDATVEGWPDEYDLVSAHLDRPPVILTPLPGRRWRVYLRPASATSDLVAEATEVIRRRAPGATFTDVENPARFRCHSRIAARFASGRVLLAGDAAHACTPFEGHGMNTGLQDAFNLGWKLALVCRGEAGPGLLDTYDPERRPAAETVVGSGIDIERAQALTDPPERAARDAEIRRVFADPASAHHEAVGAAELDRRYPGSRAVAIDDGPPPRAGVRVPDTEDVTPAAGPPRPLHQLAHRRGLTLLVLAGPEADLARAGALLADLEGLAGGVVEAVVGLSTGGGDPRLGRMDASTAADLGVAGLTVLAVRPDRYIGLRDDDGDAEAVRAYLGSLVS
jgi:2-polyprenyl-6-methoxyphenol hydroxylase-like FAD-dependent oxidoreductase